MTSTNSDHEEPCHEDWNAKETESTQLAIPKLQNEWEEIKELAPVPQTKRDIRWN